MITEQLARSQIEAVLLSLQPSLRRQKAAQATVIRLESGEIMDCIERSVKSLKELFDSEARKMIVEFAKDVAFGFEALFRAQLAFLQAPETGFDVERAESIYAGIQNSFQEKYAGFFAVEHDKPAEVFLSMKENLEEIRAESARLIEQLSKPVAPVPAPAQPTQPEAKQAGEPRQAKQGEGSGERKPDSSFFSSIKNVFSKLKPGTDGFIKTDLGKDSSGMKWDPVKKKWCFDDAEEEPVEEVKKLPPKKKDVEQKKLEDAAKDPAPPAEQSIADSLIKPRGKTAADRAKARRTGGDKPAPKVARLSANVFAGINSQAATFTFEQQRELIIFELRELVSSSLNQMKPVSPEPESPEEPVLGETDMRLYRARLVDFVENALQRAYCHTRAALRSARVSGAQVPQPRFEQACQTEEPCDQEKRELAAQLEALQEKLTGLELWHERETQALARQAASFRQLASHTTDAALREHQTSVQLAQLVQDPSEQFSDEELQSLRQLFGALAEAVQSCGKTASRAKSLRSCLELLLQAHSKQSDCILAQQRQLREQQAQLLELGRRQALLVQEKQALKAASCALLQESLHYQSECDRLHLASLKARKDHTTLLQSHEANVHFCNRLLVCFKQRAAADQQAYEQIFSELLNVCSLEKHKNTAATQRVEFIIKHKVESLKKDVVKLQNGIDTWQGQYELVNQERIEQIKQLVDLDSKYVESLNHVQAGLSRELEVQKKLDVSEDHRRRLEEEVGRLRVANSELQALADKLQECLWAAEEETDRLRTAAEERDTLLGQLAAAESRVADLTRESQELNEALSSETSQAAAASRQLDQLNRQLEESAAKAEIDNLQLEAAQSNAEQLATELQAAQDSIAEQVATVRLFEQLWAEVWGFIQSHPDYPLEQQSDNLKEAVEALCNSIGAKASALEEKLDQKQCEYDQLNLQHAQRAEDSHQAALEAAESKLQLAQKDFERQLEQSQRRHAEEQVSLQKMVDDLETKQNEAEKLITDKAEELDKLLATHRALQESAQRTAVQLSDLIQDKEALQLAVKQQENQLLDLQEENSRLAKDLKEHVAAASSGDAAATLAVASLQSQLEAKDTALEELRARVREEERRALTLQGELASRQREADLAQESEAVYREELGELGRRLELAQQALGRFESAGPAGAGELQQQLEEHEKRILLLQMDLLEAKKAGEDYRQEIEDLRTKLFSELKASARAGSREASELLEVLFAETK